nr:meiotically up-regulated gene 137 protein [Quercus suber]
MIVNKKFDRLKQWGRERMGGEVRTDTSDNVKALEAEMQLRHEGMEKLSRSANAYMKSISKREQGEEKEKQLPVAYFGSAMISHAEDFEPDSEFGQCLSSLGRANERIARMQETYCANAAGSWLESLERSLVQMKEYQSARKKLDQRRLAYDTAAQKIQKSKKEDFRMEEELRSQKAKFEESNEDVYRRMLDIKEAEEDSVCDLTSFLDAELMYYDRCREVLLQLKHEWPGRQITRATRGEDSVDGNGSKARQGAATGSRTSSISERYSTSGDEPLQPPRSTMTSWISSGQSSPRREHPDFDLPTRPTLGRSVSGFEGLTHSMNPDHHTITMPRLSRVPTEPSHLLGGRSGLRVTKRDSLASTSDLFNDDQSDFSDQSYRESRNRATSLHESTKRGPPPPPPSRAKKPPPPPPLKRSALSTSERAVRVSNVLRCCASRPASTRWLSIGIITTPPDPPRAAIGTSLYTTAERVPRPSFAPAILFAPCSLSLFTPPCLPAHPTLRSRPRPRASDHRPSPAE